MEKPTFNPLVFSALFNMKFQNFPGHVLSFLFSFIISFLASTILYKVHFTVLWYIQCVIDILNSDVIRAIWSCLSPGRKKPICLLN